MLSKNRDLLQDVLADTGNIAEEEEAEDNGGDTESGRDGTAVAETSQCLTD